MDIISYRLPAELEKRLNNTRPDHAESPADGFMHKGKLNMGPAIVLATLLSAGCWGILIGVGWKLFH